VAVSAKEESLIDVAARLRQIADTEPVTLPGVPGPQHATVLASGLLVVFVQVVVCGERYYQLSMSRQEGPPDAEEVAECVRAFFPGSERVRVFEDDSGAGAVERLSPMN